MSWFLGDDVSPVTNQTSVQDGREAVAVNKQGQVTHLTLESPKEMFVKFYFYAFNMVKIACAV